MPICFRILGEPASKANSRQLVAIPLVKHGYKTGAMRAASIKSEKARNYEEDAEKQIPSWARQMLQGPVKVTMRIYYASRRPDLDESIILDVMQAKYLRIKDPQTGKVLRTELVRRGVYVNDRQVEWKDIRRALDTVNPRAEIVVEPLAEQQISMEWNETLPRESAPVNG
jgi:hypothetical protein